MDALSPIPDATLTLGKQLVLARMAGELGKPPPVPRSCGEQYSSLAPLKPAAEAGRAAGCASYVQTASPPSRARDDCWNASVSASAFRVGSETQ
jgi:hypothetical protein